MADQEVNTSPQEIPYGFCQCGCGQKTNLASQSHAKKGYVKGMPMAYLSGHNIDNTPGPHHHNWKGGTRHSYGYVYVKCYYKHPRVDCNGYVLEHILVAEKALGKPLPINAVVHHINERRGDNRPENLVICNDEMYHRFLHQRKRAYDACGHADWIKCARCKQYDSPDKLHIYRRSNRKNLSLCSYHKDCQSHYDKVRRDKIKSTRLGDSP